MRYGPLFHNSVTNSKCACSINHMRLSLIHICSRTGAGAQIQAVDDAVKATSTEVISIEIPRDTKGWGGHGNFIIIGGETPADVKRAVELALEYIDINAGEIYISEAGHMEFQYLSLIHIC